VLINISDHHTRLKANSPDGAPPPLVMGCLLGSQDGRAVDVANSFEIIFTEALDGAFEIDTPFLLKKQEQCEWRGSGGDRVEQQPMCEQYQQSRHADDCDACVLCHLRSGTPPAAA
jgi:hypothetical protein